MREYWLRIAGAWLLLKFASIVMKDAEKLLKGAADSKNIVESTATEVVVDG
jgi:hypothetical protein